AQWRGGGGGGRGRGEGGAGPGEPLGNACEIDVRTARDRGERAPASLRAIRDGERGAGGGKMLHDEPPNPARAEDERVPPLERPEDLARQLDACAREGDGTLANRRLVARLLRD